MNIFVLVKQVPDTETKVKPNSAANFIDVEGIKWIMNPYDEFAVEQALLIKAANPQANITAIRVGAVKDTEALRTAMAMGVDDAILVEAPDLLDSYATAKAIVGGINKLGKKPDLILTGKQAIDTDCMQVPQMVAALLKFPSVTVIVNCEIAGKELTVKREIEGGSIEVYKLSTPCLLACNKGLNTPRYASLPGIMKAKKKPLEKYSLADVGLKDSDQKVVYSNFKLPPEKPAGKKFDAMDESLQAKIVTDVVQLLRNEAKVI
jgi:electron transfer flavoprotein beta subunit